MRATETRTISNMTYPLADSIADLLDQPVKDTHVNAMVHCPFHEDRTPSFSIHLEEGVWHCFSCGDSGTLKKLYRKLGKDVDLNVRLYQSKRQAEETFEIRKNFAAKANECIAASKSGNGEYRSVIRNFLDERAISSATARHFGIGWESDRQAISFPYADVDNRVTGIKYRYRDGFKASESGSHYGLYGVNDAVGKEIVFICEGESDTLATFDRLHRRVTELGGDEELLTIDGEVLSYGVCGTSGASVSESQWSRFSVHLLFARRVYLLYDTDEAGDKCAENAMRLLGDKYIRLRPTRGKDVSEHLLAGGTLREMAGE